MSLISMIQFVFRKPNFYKYEQVVLALNKRYNFRYCIPVDL